MRRSVFAVLAALVCAPNIAHAVCGFDVAPGEGQQLVADATQVVLMRKGPRTVLSQRTGTTMLPLFISPGTFLLPIHRPLASRTPTDT